MTKQKLNTHQKFEGGRGKEWSKEGRQKIRNLEDKGNYVLGGAMGGVCKTNKVDT
jgi:hypothetical protein